MLFLQKSLPNILTMSRFVGLTIATVLLFDGRESYAIISGVIYFYVAVTDYVDGYLARRFDAVTDFGKLMDPIADKAYVLTLYFSFVVLSLISVWWVIPILIREVAITVIRMVLARRGYVIASVKSGKLKTVYQIASLVFLYLLYINITYWQIGIAILSSGLYFLAYLFLILAVAWTIYSGAEFFRLNWGVITGKSE